MWGSTTQKPVSTQKKSQVVTIPSLHSTAALIHCKTCGFCTLLRQGWVIVECQIWLGKKYWIFGCWLYERFNPYVMWCSFIDNDGLQLDQMSRADCHCHPLWNLWILSISSPGLTSHSWDQTIFHMSDRTGEEITIFLVLILWEV